MFGHTANKITGSINARYNRVQYYFQLKATNDSLVRANETLYNQLKEDYNLPDSLSRIQIKDTLKSDSITQYRIFDYIGAKVVANSVTAQNNYIVLSGKNVPFFKEHAGVVDVNNAVVGTITEISGQYAVVMSLLHSDSRLSAKLLNTGEVGTLSWDDVGTPNLLSLSGIPKSVVVKKGDSVITSGFSTVFPKGLLLGRIEDFYKDKSSGNFKITVRTASNFYNLQYGYVILNSQKEVIDSLLNKQKQ